jgi:RNA polymerase sigma-70 factor (ECF subfamily)
LRDATLYTMDDVIRNNGLASQDEEILVRRAQQKDTEAFARLYEAYFDKIYRYLALRIRNDYEAEDLTQQVFMKVMKSISSYKITGVPFSSWLYRIAHNQLVDFLRQKNKKATVTIEGLPIRDTRDDPQYMMEKQVDIDELQRAVGQLTAAQQEVLALRFTGELSIAQCAEIMGRSQGAIKALQHSAVLALRKAMMST